MQQNTNGTKYKKNKMQKCPPLTHSFSIGTQSILFLLYFGVFVFWYFAFCSIFILLHLYFVTFVLCTLVFFFFVFWYYCILFHLYFVAFIFCYICILAIYSLTFWILSYLYYDYLYFVWIPDS